MVSALEKRELIAAPPHPRDGRAMGLHLTASGQKLMRDAERTAAELEAEVSARADARRAAHADAAAEESVPVAAASRRCARVTVLLFV
jgi:DNA-binding MarR family transcriptional regulator